MSCELQIMCTFKKQMAIKVERRFSEKEREKQKERIICVWCVAQPVQLAQGTAAWQEEPHTYSNSLIHKSHRLTLGSPECPDRWKQEQRERAERKKKEVSERLGEERCCTLEGWSNTNITLLCYERSGLSIHNLRGFPCRYISNKIISSNAEGSSSKQLWHWWMF